MIKACFFDMDGTLIDSEVLWVESVEMLLRDHGREITRDEALRLVYGVPWQDIHPHVKEMVPSLDMDIDEMSIVLRPYFERLRAGRDIRIAGSIDLLKRLSEELPVCIVSGSTADDVEAGIEMMGVEPHLAFYLAMEHYSPGKPDPACFLMAARRLGLPPEDCLVFEDSNVGVRAAKGAGMHCVALAREGRPSQDLGMADMVLADLAGFSVVDYETGLGPLA